MRINIRRYIVAILQCIPSLAFALAMDDLPWPLNQSLPSEVYAKFAGHSVSEQFIFTAEINPFYLNGDFDGDGWLDTAVEIKEKSSNKAGIAIAHSKSGALFIIGAGHSIGHGGDDFSWKDAWYIYPAGKVVKGADQRKPPELKSDAIYLQKTEAAGALLYWDGKKYTWYQQGD